MWASCVSAREFCVWGSCVGQVVCVCEEVVCGQVVLYVSKLCVDKL